MNTPIFDFINEYKQKNAVRLHMPGHKGKSFLGIENCDITEIDGADVLYNSNGIIEQSQQNAKKLFDTKMTVYSCEGSSLSIKAMLYLALLYCGKKDGLILATRNAHKAFINSAVLLGFDIEWMICNQNDVISCNITAEELDSKLKSMSQKPVAFYITSPDYLGNITDIELIANVCHKHNVLLICDNAHGAYLKFLPKSMHPISLGADMCCDSAHKTLPVLTGGGYLHIGKNAPDFLCDNAKRAMSLFASTSPSYLIMQSLDITNKYIDDGYGEKLQNTILSITKLKQKLIKNNFVIAGNEPIKLTIMPKNTGYTGEQMAEYLKGKNIVCEFCDKDYIVFMFTPETSEDDIQKLETELLNIPKREKITTAPPKFEIPQKKMLPREAAFSNSEIISASESLGRVVAFENVSCPPAIPIIVSGEVIDENTIELFNYYGIKKITVVK